MDTTEITESMERSEAMDRRRAEALRGCRAVSRGWLTPEEVKAAHEGLVDFLWYLKSSYNERDAALRKLLIDAEDLPDGLPDPISTAKDGSQVPSKAHMLLYLTIKVPGLTNEGYAAIMNPSILDLERSHRGRKSFVSAVSSASAQIRLDPGNKTTSKNLVRKTEDTAKKSTFFRTELIPKYRRGFQEAWAPDPLLFPASRGEQAAPELAPVPAEEPPARKDPLVDAIRSTAKAMREPAQIVTEAAEVFVANMRDVEVDPLMFRKPRGPVTVHYRDVDDILIPLPTREAEEPPSNPVIDRLLGEHRQARDSKKEDLAQIEVLVKEAEDEIASLLVKANRIRQEIVDADVVMSALENYRQAFGGDGLGWDSLLD